MECLGFKTRYRGRPSNKLLLKSRRKDVAKASVCGSRVSAVSSLVGAGTVDEATACYMPSTAGSGVPDCKPSTSLCFYQACDRDSEGDGALPAQRAAGEANACASLACAAAKEP